ncbi:MAG: putative transporter [Candidatus Anaerobiospirillum pullicola]|uniref:Transporter n=1 Tax=Candidatus Anaerobiospirillum pullicola TaxID=2838451 RepID=A0A948X0Q0_9GAMM|nr:putative transporter [Candidatus Anaerobiospirillum pullicola]
MSTIPFLTLAISIAAVLGILLGEVRYRGIGLGIGGVLFSGILVGHFSHEWFGLTIRTAEGLTTAEGSILGYVQEFGLILFVYAIGVQVGPSFFSSLRSMGAKLVGWVLVIIVMGCSIAMILHFIGIVKIDAMVGMYSGAITNTPALGAANQMIIDMRAVLDPGVADELGFDSFVVPSAYAMAYPFGVCGILLTMILIRIIFRVNIEEAGRQYLESKVKGPRIETANITVSEGHFAGQELEDVPGVREELVVCSRIKRGEDLIVPHLQTKLEAGDVLHFVGPKSELEKVANAIGTMVQSAFTTTTRGTNKVVQRIVVTKRDVIGKELGDLHLEERFDLAVSRLIRAGVQFLPSHHMKLQFGDYLNVIGTKESIAAAEKAIGNSSVELHKVAMLPLFIGVILGILLGSIPIPVSGVPAPMKLGVAGGPLVMAILLSRFGAPLTGNRLRWSMPAAGLSALREIGITLFLSIVGICAGANGFWETLTNGPGLTWVWCGLLVTFIPLFTVGFLAYKFSKVNYLVLCGMIAGSQTDPPALAFANGLYSNPEASSLGYATVYPITMFLRILSPQVMIIIAVLAAGV